MQFDYLKNKSGPIWHCRIPESELKNCRFYAYRISGPGPEPGYCWHTFDSEKVLFDPYAKAVFFPPKFDREAARQPGSNEGRAPLSVLTRCECPFDWGYMPLSFFAPHHAYSYDPAACRQHDDFREMVRRLHEAEIEVILDVVYNQTAEGDGPVMDSVFYTVAGLSVVVLARGC